MWSYTQALLVIIWYCEFWSEFVKYFRFYPVLLANAASILQIASPGQTQGASLKVSETGMNIIMTIVIIVTIKEEEEDDCGYRYVNM